MAAEWVAPTSTSPVGLAGITATYLSGKRSTVASGQQPNQRGQDRPVGPVQPRPGVAPPQYRDLVPQHQQFGILGGGVASQQHQSADQPDEDQVEQPQRHGWRSSRSRPLA